MLFLEKWYLAEGANARIEERCWSIMEVRAEVPGDYGWNILRLERVFQRV